MRETDAEGRGATWRQLLHIAIVESNLPKFVEAAVEAHRAITSRLDELRDQTSTEAAEERAELERATQTLHDLLKIVPELPSRPRDRHTKG